MAGERGNTTLKFARDLVFQFEKIGIIQKSTDVGLWFEMTSFKIENEATSIYLSFFNYLKHLPDLNEEERQAEKTNLRNISNMLMKIRRGINSESKLSNSDIRFRETIENMNRLLVAFKKGLTKEENPAEKINQAYKAGLEYKKRKKLRRKR